MVFCRFRFRFRFRYYHSQTNFFPFIKLYFVISFSFSFTSPDISMSQMHGRRLRMYIWPFWLNDWLKRHLSTKFGICDPKNPMKMVPRDSEKINEKNTVYNVIIQSFSFSFTVFWRFRFRFRFCYHKRNFSVYFRYFVFVFVYQPCSKIKLVGFT